MGALQIDAHHLVVEFFSDLEGAWIDGGHARVVHEDIDLAEMIECPLGECVAVVPMCDVAADGEGPLAGFVLDFSGERLASVLLAAGDDDIGADPCEGVDHLLAKSAAATCDEGDLAVESECRGGIARFGRRHAEGVLVVLRVGLSVVSFPSRCFCTLPLAVRGSADSITISRGCL